MNETVQVKKNTTLIELAKEFQSRFKTPILVAKVNNELQELYKKIQEDCHIEFLDISDPNGFRVYQRTTTFIMICAVKEILGTQSRLVVEHSINKNYYCEIENVTITQDLVDQIQNRMKQLIQEKIPIEKCSLTVEEANNICLEMGLYDKIESLKYRRASNVNFYRLSWFYDYFYGPVALNTKYIFNFQLEKQDNGLLLQFPCSKQPEQLAEKKPLEKIQKVFAESSNWNKILDVEMISSLNNIICSRNIKNFIRTNEALHEKKIAQIADMIFEQKKHIVLIAGPSSSGKTTFAERLCIQLGVNGFKPQIISLDDYYVNTGHTPLDEFGKPDFESIEALDIKQINEDLSNLLEGKKVEMPTFNFETGKREYKGKYLQLNKDSVLVIEGIHGLNERLTANVSTENKFKIFISALRQLNIDDHNRIATTDTRLLRRIVRDSQYRGMSAESTIAMWPSVLRGEIEHIFPFQEEADAVFNSSLVYEMAVLKQYAEANLFGISKSVPQYAEARRLIKFLDSFLNVDSEQVPQNSIIREFIGGSSFHQ